MALYTDHVFSGNHATRPAVETIGAGSLYICSTHRLIYETDGSSWSTFADLSAIGASGGGAWSQLVDEDGASFASFAAIDGTWASDGTTINQTEVSTNERNARYDTKLRWGAGFVVEAEVQFPTSGQGSGGNVQAKLVAAEASGNETGGCSVYLDRGASQIGSEQHGNSIVRSWPLTVALDTWYKLRMMTVGRWVSIYLDGTLIGTTVTPAAQATADYLQLATYNASVKFRNVKAWTLAPPA